MAPRSDGQVEFWDIAARRFLKDVRIYAAGYTARDLHPAPDGRSLVLIGSGPATRLRVFWVSLHRRLTGCIPDDPTEELAVLDLATDRVVARLPRGRFVGFSPDRRTVVTQDSTGAYSFRDIPGR